MHDAGSKEHRGIEAFDPSQVKYDDRGLVTVVAQDIGSGAVLMVAWADREALGKTVETGKAWFWSRSREKLWMKGESSGNVLDVLEILVDCDADTLLYRVHPTGPACHRGTRTCFEPNPARLELGWLWDVLEARRGADPETSYTARLLGKGRPKIAQKVGEEAVETVIAALTGEGGAKADAGGAALASESADLLYHLLVLLLDAGGRSRPPHRRAPCATRRAEDAAHGDERCLIRRAKPFPTFVNFSPTA